MVKRVKHSLNLTNLTMIVVSLIIGMGIFKTPAIIAAKSGNEYIYFSVWIIGGLIALCGALTYSEIGKKLPFIGGYYKIFSECYKPSFGFTINILILVSNAASLAIVALIGADYLSDLLFQNQTSDVFRKIIAIISVLIFYFINLKGLKTSSTIQNVLTFFKIAIILVLSSALINRNMIEPHSYNQGVIYNIEDHSVIFLMLVSLVAVSFTYGGYQQTINFGGELNSLKFLKKGIITGVLIVIFLYLLVNIAYVSIIGFDKMKNANVIGALLFESLFGRVGAKIFDFCMVISVLAYVNIILLSNPRVMYAMSLDGVLPSFFSKRDEHTGVLFNSLTIFTILTLVVILIGKQVDNIISFSIFIDSLGMISSAYTYFILRKRLKNPNQHKDNKTPIIVSSFIIFYIFVIIGVINDNINATITAIVLMLIVFLIYYTLIAKKGLSAKKN